LSQQSLETGWRLLELTIHFVYVTSGPGKIMNIKTVSFIDFVRMPWNSAAKSHYSV